MAQRQFKSNDTSLWSDKYGTGSAGALIISADTTDSSRTGYANTTLSGTEAATAATAGDGTGFSAGDLILIHQTRNGGDGAGVWELNKISSVGGGTDWTLAYALTHDYATTAQVYRLIQNSAITIDSTKTLTGVAWDGTKGGIVALLCNGTTTVTGNIVVTGKGFTGNSTTSNGGAGGQGEGSSAAGGTRSTSANGNGGGGAAASTSNATGGGGGNGATGGTGTVGSGDGGATAGNAGLTVSVLGGGGGAGYNDGSGGDRHGGNDGGGFVLIISKTISITGGINADAETNTGSGGANVGGGGGGAGGSVLLKGENLTLGSNLIKAEGKAGRSGVGTGGTGGTGGNGRIHADYATSITGTTTPTLDSTQDATLLDAGGGAFFFSQL